MLNKLKNIDFIYAVKVLIFILFVIGIIVGVWHNVLLVITLLTQIIDAFRGTVHVPSSEIAWLVFAVLFRLFIFLFWMLVYQIPTVFVLGIWIYLENRKSKNSY